MSAPESAAKPPEPRENSSLIGHESAERILIEASHGGRLAHAWLITGPKGIGKATLAYRFARFLLAGRDCAAPSLLDAAADDATTLAIPPEDPVFRRVASGGHADLRTVERRLNDKTRRLYDAILVDDVREVGHFLRLTPAEGGWRVVVIDSADEMNRNAANAVLKVLEEPPRRAVLLLVSHAPARLLPTIRSRCQRLVLQPLDEGRVAALLRRWRPDLPAAERLALAQLGEGSPGRALELAAAGGLGLYREMIGILAGLPRIELEPLRGLCGRVGGKGREDGYETVVLLFRWWLARLIRTAALRQAPAEIVVGEGALLDRLGRAARLERWFELWEKSDRLFTRAESLGLDRRQVVMNAFLAFENVVRA